MSWAKTNKWDYINSAVFHCMTILAVLVDYCPTMQRTETCLRWKWSVWKKQQWKFIWNEVFPEKVRKWCLALWSDGWISCDPRNSPRLNLNPSKLQIFSFSPRLNLNPIKLQIFSFGPRLNIASNPSNCKYFPSIPDLTLPQSHPIANMFLPSQT